MSAKGATTGSAGAYLKPLPSEDELAGAFFGGCRDGVLRIQRCLSCGAHQFYPRVVCSTCQSRELDWDVSTGLGKVHTFTVIRRAPSKEWFEDVPYVVGIIELQEGPRMMSHVRGCAPEDVHCDMDVEVFFENVTEEVALPYFRPRVQT
jgi:uncharacterized protein